MSARFTKIILFAALVTGLVCYLFYQNPESATVRWASRPDAVLQAPMALVIVVIFFSGVLCSALFALIIGVRYQLRDWRLSRDERMRKSHHGLLISARERLAAGRYASARELLAKIIERDPSDIIAHIQLAQSYRGEGHPAQALAVLEKARAGHERNAELLFLAAELNRELGNHTAASDNLRLILEKEPRNTFALEALIDSSSKLERYDEAVGLEQQLVRYAQTNQEQQARLDRLALLELLQAKKRYSEDRTLLRSAVEELLKRHRDFVPALVELARLDREAFQLENANKLYLKAFKLTPNVEYLYELCRMWLAVDEPQKAIANVRVLLQSKELAGEARAHAQIFFAALLLRLESIEEATLERRRVREVEGVSPELLAELRVLDAFLLRRNADIDEAFELLFRVALERKECRALEILDDGSVLRYEGLSDWIALAHTRTRTRTEQSPRLLTT